MSQMARGSCKAPVTVGQIPRNRSSRTPVSSRLRLVDQNTSLEHVLRRNLICCLYPVLEEKTTYQLTWQKSSNLTTRAIHSKEHDITRGQNYCRDNLNSWPAELGRCSVQFAIGGPRMGPLQLGSRDRIFPKNLLYYGL